MAPSCLRSHNARYIMLKWLFAQKVELTSNYHTRLHQIHLFCCIVVIVHRRLIGSALVQVMAWHQIGDKPLSEPWLTRFIYAHICGTRGRWVNRDPVFVLDKLQLKIRWLELSSPDHIPVNEWIPGKYTSIIVKTSGIFPLQSFRHYGSWMFLSTVLTCLVLAARSWAYFTNGKSVRI